MAIGSVTRPNSAPVAFRSPLSAGGMFVEANDGKTAQAAGELTSPATINDAGFHWIERPAWAARAMVRLKYATAITAMTTPVGGRLVGAKGNPADDGSFSATPGAASFAEFARLDNADNGGTAMSLSVNNTNDIDDGTYGYGAWASLTPVDLLNFPYVGFLVSTAGTGFTGSGTVVVELYFLP